MKKNILIFLSLSIILTISAARATSSTILIYGDSLSANYGIPTETGWVALLEQRIKKQTPHYQIVNASISGETTLGGRNRIDRALAAHDPEIIVIELGANDGLQGTAISTIHENLAVIIEKSQKNNTRVLLVGMRLPPNYGATYTNKFKDIFIQLTADYQTSLVPFLFEGFESNSDFFLSDRLHPNEMAQSKIAETVWQTLQPMLRSEQNTP